MEQKKSLKLNALLNALKQVCVIAFPMITFPYASRILGANNYGKINFGSSIVSYISSVAALGITNYAITEGAKNANKKEKFSLFVDEVFSLNIFSTVIAEIILVMLVTFWPKLNSYMPLIWIQNLTVIFTTIGVDWLNTIFEDYLYMTIRYIICQTLAIILMFVLVKGPDDYIWYAFTNVFATILANILNLMYIRINYKFYPQIVMRKSVFRHLKSVLILFGSSAATLIYINSDITLLGILGNDKVVGYYSISSKIYKLVKQLINAVLVVSIPRISKYISDGNQEQIDIAVQDTYEMLILLIAPATTGLLFLNRNIIVAFSGYEYLRSSDSLVILSSALLFATLACFYVSLVMLPYRLDKEILFATIVSAVSNIGLNIILIPVLFEKAAALTTLISEGIMVLFGIYYSRNMICIKRARALCVGACEALGVGVICSVILKVQKNDYLVIVYSVILAVIYCMGIVGVVYRKKILSMIKK